MRQLQTSCGRNPLQSARWTVWCVILGLLIPGLCGCLGDKKGKSRAGRAAGSQIEPEDITGRWKLTLAVRGNQSGQMVVIQMDVALMDITYDATQTENKYSMNLIGLDESSNQIKVKRFKVSDDGEVSFDIDRGSLDVNFTGRLDGEDVWGSYLIPHFQLSPAKLERTELKELVIPEQPVYAAHFEDLMQALFAKDSFVALEAFTETANRSPLLFEAYDAMSSHFKKEKLSLEKVKEFVENYKKAVEVWGPRLDAQVELNVGHSLASQKVYPELAQSLLETAEPKITDEYPIEIKSKLAEAWVVLGNHEKALKRIPQLMEQDPTNANLIWLFARAKELAKEPDEAVQAYTKVAMFPGFEQQLIQQLQHQHLSVPPELPTQSAARLWKAKHDDSTKGFDEYALRTYDEVIKLFVPERTPVKRDADAMVPLIELFTGTSCQPCVAVDIAVEGLRQSYSPQEVVVLSYHQHIPRPDPFANDLTHKRAGFYGINETPSLVVNGQSIEQSLGSPSASAALQMLGFLRVGVESESQKKSPVSIKAEATRKGDEIEIKADVEGIDSLEHQPRLFLALVENKIQYPGQNRIIVHNCVVRGFAGGFRGLQLPKGKSSHFETISLPALKQELVNHLGQFDSGSLPLKPMDFNNLQVVAFVQAMHTKIVSQSVLVEIGGDAPPAVKPKTEPQDKPADPAAKPAATEVQPGEQPEKPAAKSDEALPKETPQPETKSTENLDSKEQSEPKSSP